MLVHLTRKQIADSPSIETHKPLSRQFEEEYHRHCASVTLAGLSITPGC
jgi:type IV secretory pathway VirB4 component